MMNSYKLGRVLIFRALSLISVLCSVLLLLVITLGATGYSDKILTSNVDEELRGLRGGLAQTIRDPNELEKVLTSRRHELHVLYGLNDPWYQRIPDTLIDVVTLDLGQAHTLRSYEGSSNISDIVLERLPRTLLLVTTAFFLTALLGLWIGINIATKAGSSTDRLVATFSAISFALPTWWVGIILILFLSIKFHIFPSGGMYSIPPPEAGLERFLDLLSHSILPVFTLVLVSVGPYIYSVRTMTLNIAQEDFISVAKAKGLPNSLIMRRHILRAAAPPIVTSLTLSLIGSLGGSILVETVFNWQGMGRLYFDAVTGKPDEGIIIALTFIFTLLYVAARFFLEVIYLILDPRVRYSS